MPQMAPTSWLMLFIIFSISFMIFNMLNYYSFIIKMPKFKINKNKKMNFHWKW